MLYTGYLDFKIKPEYQMQNEVRALVDDFIAKVNEGQVDYSEYSAFLKQYGQQLLDVEKPSLGNNITYMLEYQLGYMYWRYFMWNFTGRQDDIQGKYNMHGNWISGINFIDEMHLDVSQDNLPSDVLNNKARNTYYFLPLILGLIGLFFLFNTDKKLFWTMLVFFLFTGIAIQVYTNVRPFEPRERDYSVVGSFYVFAIWIGFGAYALYDLLTKFSKHKLLAPAVSLVCLILVPGILAANNWDDHDRSGKRTANSMARTYLESCAPNAILFTIGDNDSFPLWYLQEIEGVRTDVRVVNTSLFQTDWYIDQMKRKAYESDPIPSQLTHDQYKYGTNDYVVKAQVTRDTLDIKELLNFIASDNPRTKYRYVLQQDPEIDINRYRNQELNANYFPTENVRIPVDKASVLDNGIVKAKDADKIVPYIDIKIKGSALYKNRLLMLDIVANNNWERPIYFTGGAFGDDDYIWMKDYLQLDGLCYKLVPIKTPVDKANPFDMGRIDSDLMYEKVKNWDWGNSGMDIYHDVETRKNGISYRGNLARLIETLINEKQFDKAEEIADLAMAKMPVDVFGYYTLLEPYISAYYEVKAKDKAQKLFFDVSKKYQESLTYFSSLSEEKQGRYIEEISTDISRYRGLIDVLMIYEDKPFVEAEMQKYNNFIRLFTGESPEEFNNSIDKDIPSDTTNNTIEIDSNE